MKKTRCAYIIVAVWAICTIWAAPGSAQTTTKLETDPLHQLNNSVRALVKRVTPSVVHLIVTGYGPVENNRGNTSLVLGKQQSVGSGVIIDPNGYIITNAHMVRGAHRVQVSVPAADSGDGGASFSNRSRLLEARIVGMDSEIDLALLKIEASNLPAIRLADYNKLRQGEVVFAFGSPEGLQDSVTMGVVSAVARQTDPDNPFVYIQTDAPINPGNSGGPLINVDGEMVGMNTFILTSAGGSEGLGFAIPSAVIAFAYPQLQRYGHVHRGEAGVAIQEITPALAAGLKLPSVGGMIVSDIAPGSPAESAGLKVMDIVTTIDDRPADNLSTIATSLFMRSGGERIKLGVLRGSEKLSFEISTVEPPRQFDRLVDLVDPSKSLVPKLGIVGIEIDAKVAANLPPLRISSGVIVAARAADPDVDSDLTAGDVIHSINGTQVTSIGGLRSVLDHLPPNCTVALQIERDGKLLFVPVDVD